jgi:hypothetical protein
MDAKRTYEYYTVQAFKSEIKPLMFAMRKNITGTLSRDLFIWFSPIKLLLLVSRNMSREDTNVTGWVHFGRP